jgi:hypothetical protein
MDNWWEEDAAVEQSPEARPSTPRAPTANEWWSEDTTLETKKELTGNALSRGVERGTDMFGQFMGSAIEGAGGALGIESLEDYGRTQALRNRAELSASSPGMTTSDIEGAGSLGSFVGEKLGESALPMGTSILAATGAGAAAGSIVPGLGTLAGALIGAGAATIANLPYMFGSMRERQKDVDIAEGREIQVDETAALLAAVPASALDSVSDLFILGKFGKFLKPLGEGTGLFTRVTAGAAGGAAVEAPTELGQTVIERFQAGLPLTGEDAENEYWEAAIAAGLVGGTVGGATSIPGGGKKPSTDPTPTSIPDAGGTPEQDAALSGAPVGNTAPVTKVEPDEAAALVRTTASDTINKIRAKAAAAQTPPPVPAPVPAPSAAAELSQTLSQERPPAAPAVAPVAPTSDLINTLSQPRPVTPEVTPPVAQAPMPAEAVAQAPGVAPIVGEVPTAQVPETPEQAAPADDIPTVPETREQIEAQMSALVDPKDKRVAVFVPYNGFMPIKPEGNFVGAVPVKDGVIFYNSRKKLGSMQVGKGLIKVLNAEGRRNELLGLGPLNKDEVAAQGPLNLGVVERNEAGVPVKEVAATETTVPEQVASLEEQKSEGSTIEVVPAEEVLAARTADVTPEVAPKAVKAKAVSKAKEQAPVRTKADIAPEEIARIEAEANAPKSRMEIDPKTGKRSFVLIPNAAQQRVLDDARAKQELEAERGAAAKAARTSKDATAEGREVRKEGVLAQANRGELNAEEEITSRVSAAETKKNPKRVKAKLARFRDAAKLLKELAPATAEDVRSVADASRVFDRFARTLAEAKERGIVIGKQVTDDVSNGVAWLIQMQTLAGKLEAFSRARPDTQKQMLGDLVGFLANEQILVSTGDSTAIRQDRKQISDDITNSKRGKDAEGIADTSAVNADEQVDAKVEEEESAETARMADADEESSDDVQDAPGDLPDVAVEQDEADTSEDDDFGDPDDVLLGPDGKPGFERPAPVIEGEAFIAGTNKTATVEVRKSRKVTRPGKVRPYGETDEAADMGDLDRNGQEADFALETSTLAELQGRLTSPEAMNGFTRNLRDFTVKQLGLQNKFARMLLKTLNEVVGGVKVHMLDDVDFDRFAPKADAYYNKDGDYIAIRKSAMDDNVSALHTVIHEAAHAAFEHTIKQSAQFRKQLEALLSLTRAHAELTGYGTQRRGFLNIHEFLSETWGNPSFQEFLANTPITAESRAQLGIKGSSALSVKNALAWIKNGISQLLGIREKMAQSGLGSKSLLDSAMDLSGEILALSPKGRERYYSGSVNIVNGVQPSDRAGSNRARLEAAGLSPDVAESVAGVIDEEFDGKVSDEEFDALVGAFRKPNTGAATPGGNIPVPPRIEKVLADKPGRVWMGGRVGKLLLKMMTLDGISRRGRAHFKDSEGNAMLDYENAALEHDTIRRGVEEVHYEDFAEFEELRRTSPEAAEKLAGLIGDLAPVDVELGPNAANKHLEGNARKNLQAKARLPELKAAYAALKASHPEAVALLHKMADHYRDSFNQYVRAVTYNILAGLETKLSNSDLMRIMENAVEGKLTNQDELDINDPVIFGFLKKSEKLRVRKGMYFPSVRFGDWVVQTRVAVKNPGITSVVTKSGRVSVPVKTEIEGGTIRFIFDNSIRGSNPAVTKKVYDYVAKNDLPLSSYVVRYRDRATGEIVGKGDMDVTATYDMVHEVRFQNEGVHFFESRNDAIAFFDEAQKDKAAGSLEFVKGVMAKHEVDADRLVGADKSSLDGVMRALKNSGKLSEGQINMMAATVKQAITMQLSGNRYEKRLLGRKNVAGASKEVGRAAAIYGRSVGNAVAGAMSGQNRREALERMKATATAENDSNRMVNELRSQIVNELTLRENLDGQPLVNDQILNDLMTVNSIDKLASPANWLLNSTQVMMSTAPILGGRFGNAKAAKVLASTYKRIGAHTTVVGGLKNTVKGVTSWGKTQIDPENLLDSISANLGPKYKDLLDTMVSRGDISEGVGIENAEQFSAGRGAAGMALGKVDRIARQMPNAIEAINRSVTAVASYDLARDSGMGHQDAIQFATDTLRRTQFRYDAVNTPRLMQENRAFKFFFTFKKFGFGQYQLFLEMVDQKFNGASLEERQIAGKQLGNLLAVQAMTAGVFSLPGTEIIKTAIMLGAVLGLTDGWEDWVEWLRGLMEESVGKDMAQVFSKGLVSKAVGVDLSSRMSWADLITGFPPSGSDEKSTMEWFGRTLLGAPGTMPIDMAMGAKQFVEGALNDSPKDMWKGISRVIPVKVISDVAKAAEGVRSESMTPGDAIKQVIGFKSLAKSDEADATGASIRANTAEKKAESKLISNYLNAKSRGDVVRATAAIRQHNRKLGKDEREISVDGLEKKRREIIRASQ